jgi:ABC-type glycerol-3-phosphate transport system permease component
MNFARTKNRFLHIVAYALLIFFLIFFLVPVYFLIILSSHYMNTALKLPPPIWFGDFLASNFIRLFTGTQFLRSVLNSVIIVASSVITQVFFCTMAGFAFAKYDFPFKKFFFFLILATLMVPQFVNIVPFYSIVVAFGWINTFLPLIIPTMANAFGIYLMREYIERLVPNDLINAGQIDGLGHFQTLMKIVFPCVQPAIGVVATVTAVTSWNEFIIPVLTLTKDDVLPVLLWIHKFTGTYDFGPAWLGSIFSTLPLFLVFFIFAKTFIRNLVSGSIKG